ncbi:ABC transporter permease [Megalodesulfovibrio gigas]|uniref:Putative ABC transporter n=1 Tax=Megalodesulfovibrio gigas (strain ATCC 19364 / DSM 1382 / NCIMB 9332 / VKM B-1759) TaxID=1121448 RepID=T2GBL1_MEGG1|nr:ABC transporter permease [Megalodesulfovibrio gigas]AGW13302.1 putative ABC transporter [Megalodesulfovibrio gigas DSM 1382 = ATCC 19364]
MIAFLIRRILQACIVMGVISLIGFSLRHTIGDPVREMYGMSVSAEVKAEARERLGLNDPIYIQYFRFLKNAVQGDLGNSLFYQKPALEVILSKAPATLELVFSSALLITVLSVPCGIYSAIHPRRLLSRMILGVSTVGVSVPVFFTALMCISLFSITLGWLPSFGRGELTPLFGGAWETGLLTWSGISHLIMPSFALTSIMLPLFIRLVRAEMMEVLQMDYVKYARAKGLSERRIYWVHAFRNTLLPVITVGGVQLGILIAFTILTETVFNWKGLGGMFKEAVDRGDTSLLVAYMVVVGALFVVVNTLVDVIYGLVNPMVRVVGRK